MASTIHGHDVGAGLAGTTDLAEATDRSEFGGKAAGLATAMAAGFTVPQGVAIGRSALPAWLGDEAEAEPVTADAAADVLDALGGRVAVRSSAVAEDGVDSSFAGQYETVLDVTEPAALVAAVRRCVASGRAANVRSYADARHGDRPHDDVAVPAAGGDAPRRDGAARAATSTGGVGPTERGDTTDGVAGAAGGGTDEQAAAVAVVVQRMLTPSAAGVAFSVDPVTGAEHVVVEAVAGVGEHLLAGEQDGERWEAGEDRAVRVDGPPVLDEGLATRVAALCRRAASAIGAPADVEWAFADGDLHLLQVRPITEVPLDPTARPPAGQTFVREPRFDGPLTPLTYSVWIPRHARILTASFEEFGAPIAALDSRRFHGRVYGRTVPLVDSGEDRPPPPAPIMRLLATLHPAMRRRLRNAHAWDGDDRIVRLLDEWDAEGRAATRQRTRALRRTDLAALGDAGLADHLDAVTGHLDAVATDHFRLLFATSLVAIGRLGLFVEEHLGWPAGEVLALLQGHGEASTSVGGALRDLAEALGPDGVRRGVADPTWLATQPATAVYLDAHGHRAYADLATPTEAEEPRLVADHLARLVGTADTAADEAAEDAAQDVDDDTASGVHTDGPATGTTADELRRRAAEHEARAVALLGDDGLVTRFRSLLAVARRGRPLGDETELTTLDALALVRPIALEAGRRFVDDGRLRDVDDVFFLEVDGLRAMLRDGGHAAPGLDRRRREHRWAEANPAPSHLGPPPAPTPPPSALPRRVRWTVGAMLWAAAHADPAPPRAPSGGSGRVLHGTPCSAGVVTGTARIVRSPADFERIRPGDVLVCPTTIASWSPVFTAIAGLVTEHGGLLSHPATLAREYGLPAVLAVHDATSLIEDGARIRLDGAAGTVEPL